MMLSRKRKISIKKDLEIYHPKSKNNVFENTVGWAIYFLGEMGAIENIERGEHYLTKEGK